MTARLYRVSGLGVLFLYMVGTALPALRRITVREANGAV